MVSGLKHLPHSHLLAGILCFASVSIACAAGSSADVSSSSALPDPTRPPAEFLQAGSGGGDSQVDQKSLYSTSGLQAVFLNKNGRSRAVINGETVSVGGKVGENKLVSLTDSEALLLGPNGREVLRLTPGIEKKVIVTHKTVRSKKRNTGKKTSAKSKNKLKRIAQ